MRQSVVLLCAMTASVLSARPTYSAEPADMEVHFVSQTQFAVYIPDVVRGNYGYFVNLWNNRGEITRAVALIATDTSQADRTHTIREEITQALGPMRDSETYPDSIFYQEYSVVDHFTDMDKAVIRMLYSPDVQPNMTANQAEQAVKKSFTPKQISYFKEISFGAEYAEHDQLAHKWMRDVKIHVSGQLTDVDVRTVKQVVGELNQLIGTIQLKVVGWDIDSPKTRPPANTTVATAKPKAKPASENSSQGSSSGKQKSS